MDSLNILATFDFEGQKYVITLKSEKIDFYRLENGMFYNNLSSEELDTCLEVLDNIAIQKETSIYLRNKKVGNNVYQIFYDTKTRLYWWIPLTTKEVILEEHNALAFLYNNRPSVYYFKTTNSNDDKKTNANSFSLFRKVKKILIQITVNSTITFLIGIASSKLGMKLVEMYSNWKVEEYRKEIDDSIKYDWRQIEAAINQNPNLNEEEKNFIKKLKIVYDADHEYMNIPMIIERLKTLKIKYSEDKIINMHGSYKPKLNEIFFAHAQGINDVDERVIIHELMHLNAIYSNGDSDEFSTELATLEILLKLIENGEITPKEEWYDSNGGLLTTSDSGYLHDLKLFYILLNLFDSETVKKYLYQTDERELAEALKKIDTSANEEEKNRRAYNLILNFANFKYENGIPVDDYKSYSDEECYEQLNYYYKLALGHPIEEDFNSALVFFDEFDITYKKLGSEETKKVEKLDWFYLYTEEDVSYAMRKAMSRVIGIEPMDIFDITARPRTLYFKGNPEIYVKGKTIKIDNFNVSQKAFEKAFEEELENKKKLER